MDTRLLLSLILLLAFSACEVSTEIEPINNPDPWKLSTEFSSNNESALRAAIHDEHLLVLGDDMVSRIGKDHDFFHINHPGQLDQLSLPMTANFLPLYEQGRAIHFFTSSRTANADFATTVDLASIHPDIIDFPTFAWTNIFSVNNNNQLLVPLLLSDNSQILMLFDEIMEDISGRGEMVVKEVSFKEIAIPHVDRISFTQGMPEGFLVSYQSFGEEYTAFIDHAGNISQALDRSLARGVFPLGDSWYGWRQASDKQLFRSDDGGKTWQGLNFNLHDGGLADILGLMGHMVIEEKTFVFDVHRIYEVEKTPEDRFQVTILDEEGIEGNTLLTLIKWQDKVYACTRSGLFSRSVADFYTPLLP
jgi:hypothetical protein